MAQTEKEFLLSTDGWYNHRLTLIELGSVVLVQTESPFCTTKFSLTNFICQMFFDRVNLFRKMNFLKNS